MGVCENCLAGRDYSRGVLPRLCALFKWDSWSSMQNRQLYMESPRFGKKRNCIQAKFSACNGVIKRVIRLPQGEKYRFVFSTDLTRGRVCIEIYRSKKEGIVTLSPEQPSALVSTGTRATYSAAVKFAKATGEYKLVWDAVSYPPETPVL